MHALTKPAISEVWRLSNRRCRRALSTLLLSMLPGTIMAQPVQETLYDVYRIGSEASAEVDNDLMVATLLVQKENTDAAALAASINTTMAAALETLKAYDTIVVKTRDYQTYPRYDSSSARKLIGWRAQQSVELETDDFAAAGKAIQALQETLTVQSITLSVKPASREKATDRLIETALDLFKDRARLIQRNMNADSYLVLNVDINTQQSTPAMVNRPMMSEMASSRSVSEAPAIAAGTSTVYVRVDGRIQLD